MIEILLHEFLSHLNHEKHVLLGFLVLILFDQVVGRLWQHEHHRDQEESRKDADPGQGSPIVNLNVVSNLIIWPVFLKQKLIHGVLHFDLMILLIKVVLFPKREKMRQFVSDQISESEDNEESD
jgi:hypothetical protein